MNIKNIQQNTLLNELFSLYKSKSQVYPAHVVSKSTTEPGNPNDLSLANSTPQACFFIRSTRTPKERLERLSMVTCNGKGFALCCVPVIAVFQPVTRYRPNPGKFSGSLHKFSLELSKMFYTFLFIHSRLRISVFANSLTEAYSRLPKSDIKPLLIARKSQAKGGVYQAKAQADLAYQTLKAQYKTVEMVHIGG
ncbi:ash family protein [Glaesserella parasuis]|nr:ash family protein [Glaesserella parasuis]MCT8704377.1 ash family protein [Glaesserella parasuis]MCT8706243.1 ash family protein [Glaesserella parasuis]MCT8708718.1 ash family protein [Glaesserella parasuis]MCT8711104.1 ash family protein [Glaesserella parasuis]